MPLSRNVNEWHAIVKECQGTMPVLRNVCHSLTLASSFSYIYIYCNSLLILLTSSKIGYTATVMLKMTKRTASAVCNMQQIQDKYMYTLIVGWVQHNFCWIWSVYVWIMKPKDHLKDGLEIWMSFSREKKAWAKAWRTSKRCQTRIEHMVQNNSALNWDISVSIENAVSGCSLERAI